MADIDQDAKIAKLSPCVCKVLQHSWDTRLLQPCNATFAASHAMAYCRPMRCRRSRVGCGISGCLNRVPPSASASLQAPRNHDRRHPCRLSGRHAHGAAAGAGLSRPHRGLRPEGPGDQRGDLAQSDRAGGSRPARRRVQGVRLRRPAARHPGDHEGPGGRQRHADDARLGAVQGLHAARDAFVVAKLQEGRRDLPRQGDARRARRRRHPRLALRLDPQCLRPRAHRRRLVRRLGRQRLGQLLHRRRRAGGLRLDPPPVDLERRRRHAPDDGPGEPRRRLRRLADRQRLARPDGAHRHRPGEAARRHGRLRPGRSGDRATASARRRRAIRRARQGGAARARASASCASRWATRRARQRGFQEGHRGVRQGGRRAAQGRRRDRRSRSSFPTSRRCWRARARASRRRRHVRTVLQGRQRAVRDAQGGDGLAAVREGRPTAAHRRWKRGHAPSSITPT